MTTGGDLLDEAKTPAATAAPARVRARRRARARTVFGRLVHVAVVLLLVSFVTSLLLVLVPGDPAITVAGTDATPAEIAQVRDELGLDQPPLARYGQWISDVVRGDFGTSLFPPRQSVTEAILSRLPVTIELTLVAIGLALLMAVPLAMLCALRPGGRIDRVVGNIASAAISIPSFLGALLLIFLFVFRPELVRTVLLAGAVAIAAWVAWSALRRARTEMAEDRRGTLARAALVAAAVLLAGALLYAFWPELPRQGFVRWTDPEGIGGNLRSIFLPALALALPEGAVFLRVLRSDMIGTLREDFVLAARAKGMSTRHILLREVLRPSSFSLITVAGVSLGRLFGGAVVVEAIFRLPGMGTLVVQGVTNKDFPVVQGAVLVLATIYIGLNLLIDATYAYLDPRIRRVRR
ncbi:ABC transporter permease [Phytohabitans kaempferiae]|uniref:ABC transporter permease n=1 Tax=Phytohabitans kaempferiae TaxID=1620943 RepID=A0ABV6LZ17_9ACTN